MPSSDRGGDGLRVLRSEYESAARARHYAEERWTRTRRARRTDRRERGFVGAWLEELGPFRRALDLPCGTGRFEPLLARHAREVVSVDAAHAMLLRHPGGSRLQASAGALPFADAAFDLVLCSRLLHHLLEPELRTAVLSEFARVCRGPLIASHFDARSYQAWRARIRRRDWARFAQTPASFRAEALAAGWRERDRRFMARGWSQQTWVLLEPAGERRTGGRA